MMAVVPRRNALLMPPAGNPLLGFANFSAINSPFWRYPQALRTLSFPCWVFFT